MSHYFHENASPIIVTGAGSRIGFDLVQALWVTGYHPVVAVCRRPTDVFKVTPGIELMVCDLTQEQQRNELIDQLKSKYASLRGIIHNASVWLGDDLESLRIMQALHVEAPYHLNLALEDQLRAAPKSDIISIGDETAQRGVLNHMGYASTKAALTNLTLSFAKKYAPSIRVNTVSPGFLLAPEGADDAYKEKAMSKALIEAEPGSKPVIDAVMYLLASNYITGTDTIINGGRHLK
jgi:dihydromonapterin reductase/dihydrofolate reductase